MAISAEDSKMLAKAQFMEGFSSLFDSGEFSDLTVVCGDRSWKLHKSILCKQSEYFMKACHGEFKEAKEGCIELHDDDPVTVDAMLRFLYTFDYSDAPEVGNVPAPALFNVRVFALAEKYFLEHLRALAVAKFAKLADEQWATPDFADAIAEGYTTTTDSMGTLHKVITDTVMEHYDELFNESSSEYEHFRMWARRTPDLALEIAGLLTTRLKEIEGHPGQRQDLTGFEVFRCPRASCRELFKAKMVYGQFVTFYCQTCDHERQMAYSEIAQLAVTIKDGSVQRQRKRAREY